MQTPKFSCLNLKLNFPAWINIQRKVNLEGSGKTPMPCEERVLIQDQGDDINNFLSLEKKEFYFCAIFVWDNLIQPEMCTGQQSTSEMYIIMPFIIKREKHILTCQDEIKHFCYCLFILNGKQKIFLQLIYTGKSLLLFFLSFSTKGTTNQTKIFRIISL